MKKESHPSYCLFSLNGSGWCLPFLGLTPSYQIVVHSYSTPNQVIAITGPAIPSGTWTHVATSYSSTNGIRLWINGTYTNSSSPFTYSPSNVPNIITVGSSLNATNSCKNSYIESGQFYGMIDELKIFSRELSQTDVSLLANLS